MTHFRIEMMTKPPPKTIKAVINSLIPPKAINRGRNIEGTELLDGEEMDEENEDEENENED